MTLKYSDIYIYIYISGVMMCAAVLSLVVSRGDFWKYLIWNGETAGIFPDFFESIGGALSRTPYENGSIYPAFAYCVCFVLGKLIPGFEPMNWAGSSTERVAVTVAFYFFFICIALILLLIQKLSVGDRICDGVVAMAFLTSAPLIYAVERGNMVVLSALLTFFFIYGHASENRVCRIFSYIALACAAGLKIYPAILGVLVLQEEQRQMKKILTLLLCGLLVFFVPFVIYGDFSDIVKMINNILALNGETIADTRNFGYGFKVSIQNFIELLSDYHGIDVRLNPALVSVVFMLLLVCASFFLKQKWKRVACLCLVLVIVPTFSWIYNGIYMLPPFLLFLKETLKKPQVKPIDYLYLVLFLGMFIPMPYGELWSGLGGANKMNTATFCCFMALLIMAVCLVIEAIKSVLNKIDFCVLRPMPSKRGNLRKAGECAVITENLNPNKQECEK